MKQERSNTTAAPAVSETVTVAGLGELAKAMTSGDFATGGALVPENFVGVPERGTKIPPAVNPERGTLNVTDPDPDSVLLDPQAEEDLKKKPMAKGFDPNEPRAADGEWTSGTGHGYSKADAQKYGWSKQEHADANAHDKSTTRGGDSWHQEGSESPWAMKIRGHENGWTDSERAQATAAEGEESGDYMGRSVAWHDKHSGESWYKKDKTQTEERAQNLKAGYLTAEKTVGSLTAERLTKAWIYLEANAQQFTSGQVEKMQEKISAAWLAEVGEGSVSDSMKKIEEPGDLLKFNENHAANGQFCSANQAVFADHPDGPDSRFSPTYKTWVKGWAKPDTKWHKKGGSSTTHDQFMAAALANDAEKAAAKAGESSTSDKLASGDTGSKKGDAGKGAAGKDTGSTKMNQGALPYTAKGVDTEAERRHRAAHGFAVTAGTPGTDAYNKAYINATSQYVAHDVASNYGPVGSLAYNRAYQQTIVAQNPSAKSGMAALLDNYGKTALYAAGGIGAAIGAAKVAPAALVGLAGYAAYRKYKGADTSNAWYNQDGGVWGNFSGLKDAFSGTSDTVNQGSSYTAPLSLPRGSAIHMGDQSATNYRQNYSAGDSSRQVGPLLYMQATQAHQDAIDAYNADRAKYVGRGSTVTSMVDRVGLAVSNAARNANKKRKAA